MNNLPPPPVGGGAPLSHSPFLIFVPLFSALLATARAEDANCSPVLRWTRVVLNLTRRYDPQIDLRWASLDETNS